MDFGELAIDDLIDTGALFSAIPEMDLQKIRLLSPQSVIREGPPLNFQILVANLKVLSLAFFNRVTSCMEKVILPSVRH